MYNFTKMVELSDISENVEDNTLLMTDVIRTHTYPLKIIITATIFSKYTRNHRIFYKVSGLLKPF